MKLEEKTGSKDKGYMQHQQNMKCETEKNSLEIPQNDLKRLFNKMME